MSACAERSNECQAIVRQSIADPKIVGWTRYPRGSAFVNIRNGQSTIGAPR
jgi:hypothetical protein